MIKLVGVAFFALLLAPLPAAAAGGAADFLARLLATDFDGDCIPRHDNVFYTDGKAEVGDCGCSEPRENFAADQSALIIISRWRVVATRMETRTKAVVTVESRVIATAEGQSEKRKIVPLPQPRDEVVEYRVWRRRGRWLWVDPPELPRVGLEAVRQAVAKDIQERDEVLAKHGPNGLWENLQPHYRAELADLDALRPVAEANRAP